MWKSNRRLRIRIGVRFILIYSELALIDPSYNMLQTLLGWKKNWGGNVRWTTSQYCVNKLYKKIYIFIYFCVHTYLLVFKQTYYKRKFLLATNLSFFFFYLGVLSRTFTIYRTTGEGGSYLFNSSLPLPLASRTFRH